MEVFGGRQAQCEKCKVIYRLGVQHFCEGQEEIKENEDKDLDDGAPGAGDDVEADGLDDMKVSELKDVAESEEIELEEGLKKTEIIEAIRSARLAKQN